mgnify:CR=1 FL=1
MNTKGFLVAALFPFPALAEQCLVVGITDGDTLKLRCREQITVRLADIDAPEKGQAFGQRSKEALSDLCFGTMARMDAQSRDRYGRTVARIRCAGTDANAAMVRQGMAWAYRRYQTDPKFSVFEAEARYRKAGLGAGFHRLRLP